MHYFAYVFNRYSYAVTNRLSGFWRGGVFDKNVLDKLIQKMLVLSVNFA